MSLSFFLAGTSHPHRSQRHPDTSPALAVVGQRRFWTVGLAALLLAVILVGGCEEAATPAGPGPKQAHGGTQHAAKSGGGDPAPAVPLPAKVTPGDVLPLPPPLPQRLTAGGGRLAGGAAVLPAVSCARMAPDATFKLSRFIEVSRLGADISTTSNAPTARAKPKVAGKLGAAGKTAKTRAAKTGTLELCLFHKWRAREPGENRTHTGRVHHFVAAFPGTDVTSWTANELTRTPRSLPEDARWLSAGWAALLPTGLPDRPALAIISGRFYDGVLGEEVHYVRKARVLQMHRGRWAWVPWMSRTYQTLDIEHLRAACKKRGTTGCRRAAARIASAERGAARRLKIRAVRLAGRRRTKLNIKSSAPDPQSAWLAKGRTILRGGRWKEAIDLALRAEVVCGEAGRNSRRLIGRALRIGKVKAELAEPQVNRRPLCEPLVDKAPPKTRKVAKRD